MLRQHVLQLGLLLFPIGLHSTGRKRMRKRPVVQRGNELLEDAEGLPESQRGNHQMPDS